MKKNTKVLFALTMTFTALYLAAGCSAAPSPTYSMPSTAPAYEAPSYEQPSCEPTQEYFEDEPYDTSSEEYGQFIESEFRSSSKEPLSTFSIDVDTASYSNIRRYIRDGMLPPSDAVRVEECINYFPYGYSGPSGPDPVNIGVTISECPWNKGRHLARISLKARELDEDKAPLSNLVFLLDVSGSMNSADKLPLVKHAIAMLTENLKASDRVSIVVYAGASGVVLEGCSGENKYDIVGAISRLSAGGSTAGGAGIELAYRIAEKYYLEGGNNRVVLCTDGDFNVGISSPEGLEELIREKSETGVFLSVLGFGTGNVKDNRMETLADKGNGNYAYIDSESEAEKVLVKELSSTLYAVAKDVKVQVEFNPKAVKEYRLIGYDNRKLNPEDFNDDKKDAGEMGAGHCVTAFYELILVGSPENSSDIDDLVFQEADTDKATTESDWMYVKMRYKHPESGESKLLTVMAGADNFTMNPDDDFKFASAVTEFALILKGSEYAGDASFERLIGRAIASRGADKEGYRNEFIDLASMADGMM